MKKRRTALLLLMSALLPASLSPAESHPASIVKYRQSLMKTMAGYMGALSILSRGEVTLKDAAVHHARGLHEISMILPDLFPPGSGPDKVQSDAKSEIWKSFPDFKQASRSLELQSAKLEKAAASGNIKALEAQFKEVGKSCGSCHDKYRVKDE